MTGTAHASVVQEVIEVDRNDLPLCCPNRKSDAASMHPRVFLAMDKDGKAVCPYCGASYKLTAG